MLHGTRTEGPDRKPKVGETIFFIEPGEWPPGIPNRHNVAVHWMERWTSQTDERGHYSIRVGPETFKIVGASAAEGSDTITVTDETVLERDIHLP